MTSKKFVSFAAAALAGCSAPAPSEEPVASESYAVRYGQIVTPFGPYTAPVESKAVVALPGCTGTVIDPNWVLSAKHCGLGWWSTATSRRPSGDVTRNALQAFEHPTIDAALVRLSAPFTDVPVAPLYGGSTANILQQVVTCYGYGAVAAGGPCTTSADCAAGDYCHWQAHICLTPGTGELRSGSNTTFASTVFGYFHTATNGNGQIILPGDSGGPCFIGGSSAGINSGWDSQLQNALHVSVPDVRDWISAQMDAGGFVWAQSTAGTFDASEFYTQNSTGGTNRITWVEPGHAVVDFGGLGASQIGNVQVTAYGSDSARCKVEGFNPSATGMEVSVRCFTSAGSPANTQFTASYVRRAGPLTAEGGYLWADLASAGVTYSPYAAYQWNSSGESISVTRTATGDYDVYFPGQNFTGGIAEVTAFGAGPEHCMVQDWYPNAGGQIVRVKCFGTTGAAADTEFSARFTRGSSNRTPTYAYVRADQPTLSSYAPNSNHQFGVIAANCGSIGMTSATVNRFSTGAYAVTLPGMASTPLGVRSHVKVTSLGAANNTCKVANWGGSAGNEIVSVACFDAAGAPADTAFALSYSSTLVTSC